MASSNQKRSKSDIMKLVMSNHDVLMGDSVTDFHVKFRGPQGSLYEGGIYKIHVMLPAQYPYRSPSIGFATKILHPNVDEHSGTVCLDVINQSWSPMYDLTHVFDTFLPQLLLYPNPADPLNPHAAALMHSSKSMYEEKVRAHVKVHAMYDFSLESDVETDVDSGNTRCSFAKNSSVVEVPSPTVTFSPSLSSSSSDNSNENVFDIDDEQLSDMDEPVGIMEM